MLKKMTPNLIVEDVNSTVDWYQNVLGCFEVVLTDPESGKYDWALMACEDVEIMFQSKDSIKESIKKFDLPKRGCNAVMYIELEYLDGFRERIKDRIEIVKDIHKTPYGIQELAIRDCNGFILVFAEW
jgi:uncharacterized glyoxalase superfamily protein PhnB